MSVILLETHQRVVRKIKKRGFIIHGLGILLTALVLFLPWVSKIEIDLIRASYGVVRHHLVGFECRYALLEILRNKPLTVGQALEVADVVMDEAKTSNVPIHVVLGVMKAESEFRADALSTAGARGLMQIMPATWNMYAGEALVGQGSKHSPALNVRIGIRYLGDLLRQYGDMKKVLTVYGGFVSKKPDKYVNLVMANAERYRVQLGGVDGSSSANEAEKTTKVRQ